MVRHAPSWKPIWICSQIGHRVHDGPDPHWMRGFVRRTSRR